MHTLKNILYLLYIGLAAAAALTCGLLVIASAISHGILPPTSHLFGDRVGLWLFCLMFVAIVIGAGLAFCVDRTVLALTTIVRRLQWPVVWHWSTIGFNHHGPDGASLQSTARIYKIANGRRLYFYSAHGEALSFDFVWRGFLKGSPKPYWSR